MLKNNMFLTGKVQVFLNGKLTQTVDNLVVNSGKEWNAVRMSGVTDGVMTHMAIGTGTTPAAVGDTTLQTELDRNALTVSGGTPSGNTTVYQCTWAAGDGTDTITEAGIFNAASGGTMLARALITSVTKTVEDILSITWTITVN